MGDMKNIKPTTKKMMIEDLAVKIDGLATRAEVNAKIDASVGDLAIMVQDGFADIGKTIDEIRSELAERITGLEKEMRGMHQNFDMVFQKFIEIRKQLEEADSRGDVIDLQIRVAKLEKKVRL